MRHIRQKDAADCGIAAVAMVTGKDYRVVFASALDTPMNRGVSVREAVRLLQRLTGEKWSVRVRTHLASITLSRLPTGDQALVLVSIRGSGPHWLAWNGALLFDPSERYSGVTPRAYRASNRSATLKDVIVRDSIFWSPIKRKRARA